MERSKNFGWLLPVWILVATALTVGCSKDENIDLGEIDTTIGIGGDGLELPSNSTKRSPLGDLLKTNQGEAIDTLPNGDYRFMKGDTLEPARPKVKEAILKKDDIAANNLTVPITPEMVADYQNGVVKDYTMPADAPQVIATFTYLEESGGDHHQIDSVEQADIKGTIKIDLGVTALSSTMSKVALRIYIPKYFGIDKNNTPSNYVVNENVAGDYQTLTVNNISTAQNYQINLPINKLKNIKTKRPAAAESYLLLNNAELEMHGVIKLQVVMNTGNFKPSATPGSPTVPVSRVDMGDGLAVTHAVGWFNPDINIDPKSTDVGSIPSFLTDDRVSIFLSNPTLKIELENNIDVEGLLYASIVATYDNSGDGVKYRTLDVTSSEAVVMKQAPNNTNVKSTIVVCRKRGTDPNVQYIEKRNDSNWKRSTPIAGRNDSVMVYDMAALLSKVPTHLDIILKANANNKKKGSIDLYKAGTEEDQLAHGCGYTIKPVYEFMAPFSLEAGSTIVYNDTIDDWNKDLVKNEINFYDQSYVQLEASLENNTPLELVIMNPKPIGLKDASGMASQLSEAQVELTDANGNKINSLTIYKTGDPRNQKLYLKASGNLQKLDGIVFEVMANATQATAETLNASRHTVQIKDIKLKLNGRVTINLKD